MLLEKENEIKGNGSSGTSGGGDHGGRKMPQSTPGHKLPGSDHGRKVPGWVRVPLKVLACIVAAVVVLPLLLYIPPVQRGAVKLACGIVQKETGMKIEIGSFSLKFPLDVVLADVKVIEATGDTMVMARKAVADVKLLPLLKLDVKLNKLQLEDGGFRMVMPDSSMIMKIRAGFLEVDSRSSMSIAKSRLILNKATLRNGDVSLYMDVWKQKYTPKDTTATPFYIEARELDVENIRFAMSMLPTIDTLSLDVKKLKVAGGVIDLAENLVKMRTAALSGGKVFYQAPTPEYVAAHPAPVVPDTVPPSEPMTIKIDSISADKLAAVYTIKGSVPVPGFDPNYVSVTDVGVGLKDFYNCATTLRLPITRIAAKERSGLQIISGSGLFAMTEAGMLIDGIKVKTPYSDVAATLDLPFALMELKPSAAVNADVKASLGQPDIASFLPMAAEYLKFLPAGAPLNARLHAQGTLADVQVKNLDLAMPGLFSLRGSGYARNALEPAKMTARVSLDGEVVNPEPAISLAGAEMPVKVPPFTLKGELGANSGAYAADLEMHTPQGSLAAKGHMALAAESYSADVAVRDLNMKYIMPELGLGDISLALHASGAGFDPVSPKAHTEVDGIISRMVYNGRTLRDISLRAALQDSRYNLDLDSPNEVLNLSGSLTGTLAPDDYCAEGRIKIYNLDMEALGLSDTLCYGAADLYLDVTARPARWLYDADIKINSLDWHLPDAGYYLQQPLALHFVAEEDNVLCNISAKGANVDFASATGLEKLVDDFSKAIDVAMKQLDGYDLNVEELHANLPPFTLNANLAGNGLLGTLLAPSGLSIDTVAFSIANDSLIHAEGFVNRINTGTMALDTVTLNVKERGQLLDYRVHLGNRPGVFDEFAQVDLKGYAGSNRLSAYLNQRNLAGQTGYRIGFTAAFQDSTVSVNFTPLRSTIAYMPWTFNADNYVDYDFHNMRMEANLKASSRESSILLMTEPSKHGAGDDLHVNLTNIHIEDFMQMVIGAPPVTGTLDTDLRVYYNGKELIGDGGVQLHDLCYDRAKVGDFDLDLNAGVDLSGDSRIHAGLKVNGNEALGVDALLADSGAGLALDGVDVSLTSFPLAIANAFLGKDTAQLSGVINGTMSMDAKSEEPLLNGYVAFDNASVFVPMMGSSLKLGSEHITVADNVLDLNNFEIWGANKNPLRLTGGVNARHFRDITLDLNANAENFQLINNDSRSRGDLYGKLFLTLNAGVKGPLSHFDVNANVDILGTTDVTYKVSMAQAQVAQTNNGEVVRFVNFADTAAMAKRDTVPSLIAMRIRAALNISPGTHITVNLPALNGKSTANNRVALQPSGTLNYYMNFMGDMSLNGQLNLGEGMARYSLPIVGEKKFVFDPNSYVLFNGDILNPVLHISATDDMKTSIVNSSGNSSLVNFLITLNLTNTLSNPKVVFDLNTNDDLSLQNELQAMTPEQRSTQAMNLLLTGQYSGAGMKTNGNMFSTGMLYDVLANQLNSWAANNIRGVDLSFGVNQYDKSIDGQKSSAMTYSYQVSKSLFNNRFKIVVGGNYNTDASADESFAENLVSDVSFEYMLKQTNTLTMLVRLFRHVGFESILEGEVSEMGVGFAMRRRLGNLRNLFKVRWGKRKDKGNGGNGTDSIPMQPAVSAPGHDGKDADAANGTLASPDTAFKVIRDKK